MFEQPQAAVLHVWLAVSQHLPEVQSPVEQQPLTHWPLQQVWPEPHCELFEQPQASVEH